MKDFIGWGIIGCGDVADRKAGASFREIRGSRLAGVMRRSADKAEDFARRHGVPFWTTDADELIRHPEVDALYVATPPAHHLEYALAVCAAGKPCLVEKPAGRSAEECRQMVEAFRKAGIPFFVSYYRRHLPKFRRVKAILGSGQLGEIVSIQYRMGKNPRRRLPARVSGGGMFYNLSGHVLDLLDAWFGPLELTGSAATSAIPLHQEEDAVALTFRTRGGAVGTASWNSVASHAEDELVIEGLAGRMSLRGMSRTSPIRVELEPGPAILRSRSPAQRNLRMLRRALKLPFRETHRFRADERPHGPMLEGIVDCLRRGAEGTGSDEAALRTSQLMNDALDTYYGGRAGPFWDRPQSWDSLRGRAARRAAAPGRGRYPLGPEQLRFFQENGYLGPFECDADWRGLEVPLKKGQNLHLERPEVFQVCTHPSVTARVAQLVPGHRIALFKSRFVVKAPGVRGEIAWHQDVGDTNGGFDADGKPIPTVSAWLALDEVTAANGAMRVIPGTHRRLYGEFNKRIRADLVERGELTEEEIARAVPLELRPGQFYIFHSWVLHGSPPNPLPQRRAGLNMRYAPQGCRREPGVEHFPLDCNASPR